VNNHCIVLSTIYFSQNLINPKRYEVGEKMGFIQTTIELALQREDLKYDLLDFLNKVIEKEVAEI
jgi:UTP-glucose-1-phosphate uridylyltransferase